MKSRHLARSLAMQTLYSLDFACKLYDENLEPVYDNLTEADIQLAGLSEAEFEALEQDVKIYSSYLVKGTLENLAQIDSIITEFSTKRTLDRINMVDRNILRISFYTLLYCQDVFASIAIDEAVKLSQEFSSDRNYKFVNGVLDSYVRSKNQ